ncbi:Ppx/GppA family phosphatase [Alginatibacterium sediminis]|uniref:Ppx/GppA family phosphatase n=1 Tax=Alginatibacterium sediminis TaxID=2164068 RepID=A0A420ELE4_9ALTE|nr:Ppx/GppA phosphatase family protein [Alginatibacterium sediminis]RKF21508.1 Ppx/GppA family phosphatase [Alginatibacterium sediminis]
MFNFSRLLKPRSQTIAALDLGSNSFHLLIADLEDGELRVRDRVKEMVRMGWGLKSDGSLDAETWERALECLSRFGERLRELQSGNVRIVGTKTLRSLKKSEQFLAQAEQLLGHPIEIISGDEEARLVYVGVARYKTPKQGKRLVIDIGGGSAEVILGQALDIELKESLDMGCVALTRRFFKQSKVSAKRLQKAHVYCAGQLQPVVQAFLRETWDECLGASGTIKAVAQVCIAQQWSEGAITLKSLNKIVKLYQEHSSTELSIDGLSKDREPVFLGGVVVLRALFEGLGIESMISAQWAIREALLYELTGRLDHHDIRPASIQKLSERFHVDQDYAELVSLNACHLLEQASENWNLDTQQATQALQWAAKLILVGLDISHSDFHKHGSYIVQHFDLAGFSRSEQQALAALVRAHRKRFPSKLFPIQNTNLLRLCLLLRLAVILSRGKKNSVTDTIEFEVTKHTLRLTVSQEWVAESPLTIADLENEVRYYDDLGYRLLLDCPDCKDAFD